MLSPRYKTPAGSATLSSLQDIVQLSGVPRLDTRGWVQAVKEAVSYSRALGSLANDPTLPPGLGPVSVFGGRLQTEGRDLRELFRCAAAHIAALCALPCLHYMLQRQGMKCSTLFMYLLPGGCMRVRDELMPALSFMCLNYLIIPCSVHVQLCDIPDILWSCRIYVEESIRINDAFTEQLEDDVADMQTIMGLGAREAADIRSEIVSKNYKCAPCKHTLHLKYAVGALDYGEPSIIPSSGIELLMIDCCYAGASYASSLRTGGWMLRPLRRRSWRSCATSSTSTRTLQAPCTSSCTARSS